MNLLNLSMKSVIFFLKVLSNICFFSDILWFKSIIVYCLIWYLDSETIPIQELPHSAAETNLNRNHEVGGSVPGLDRWVKDLVLLGAVV